MHTSMARALLAAAFLRTLEAQLTLSLVQLRANKVNETAGPKCIVFHSQHKSAGHTIEMLSGWIPLKGTGVSQELWKTQRTGHCKFPCDQETWDCEKQTCIEDKHNYEYECDRDSQYVTFSGYVQTLAGQKKWGRAGDGPCAWTTMSREPVSRLVSALFYCKNQWSKDPLCGLHRLDAKKATLHQWADHWGNFLFRELLWHPELRKLAESRREFNNHQFDCWDEPWVQYKDQLAGGDDVRTPSGKKNFQAVKDHLLGRNNAAPLYDVYGVMEMWNETMAAFDHVMPLESPHTWVHAAAQAHSFHGSEEWHDEEKAMLEEARQDPYVLAALAGDIQLYNDVVVPQFKKYLRDNKIHT